HTTAGNGTDQNGLFVEPAVQQAFHRHKESIQITMCYCSFHLLLFLSKLLLFITIVGIFVAINNSKIISVSYLAENIRYLRRELKVSQQKVADDLAITRGRYAKYEDGASEPP